MNLLHDLDPGDENVIRVVVEIPKGSRNKYEIDKETGLIALDRTLHTSQDYPVDYGFVPRTLWDDDDALDVCILTTSPLYPGVVAYIRPVGILRVIDGGEGDDKILGVPVDDPRFNNVQDIEDVNPHTLEEIKHFFKTYKDLQKKVVKINGVDNAQEAKKAFNRACEMYNEKHSK